MTQSTFGSRSVSKLVAAITVLGVKGVYAEEVASPAPSEPTSATEVKIGAWVETYFQASRGAPTNGLLSLRAFDFREGFNLQNAAIDFDVKKGADSLKVTLQSGLLGVNTYDYLEPASPGSAYAAPSGANALRYLQQAYATHTFASGLAVTAGLFPTPVGFETYNVKDNWNWSKANTFYFLTYYHVGAKAAYALTKELTLSAYLTNGWNNGYETNATPSGALQLGFDNGAGTTASLVYFAGNERKRSEAAALGKPVRHMLDAWVSVPVTESLAVGAQADVGMEETTLGTNRWLAGALYTRAKVASWFYVALRGDAFTESAADPAQPLFFLTANGTDLVTSGTATLDFRPSETTSFRLEARHDRANGDSYFREVVARDAAGNEVFNTRKQSTLLAGMAVSF